MNNAFIKTRMYQLGMNQKELAKKSGLSEMTISRMFNGKKLSMATLEKLATILKCKPGDLLETSTKEELEV